MKRIFIFALLVLLIHCIGCGTNKADQVLPQPYFLHYAGGPWHYLKGPFDTQQACDTYNQANLAGAFGYCNQDSTCDVATCH